MKLERPTVWTYGETLFWMCLAVLLCLGLAGCARRECSAEMFVLYDPLTVTYYVWENQSLEVIASTGTQHVHAVSSCGEAADLACELMRSAGEEGLYDCLSLVEMKKGPSRPLVSGGGR